MTRSRAEFEAYVAARQVPLRRIAYAVCGDWHQAEDLLQTAFAKLYVAWPRVHRDGREDAYVRRIIVRTSIDEHRRPWRRREGGEVPLQHPAPEPAVGVEDRSALVDALQQLPEMQRKTVLLRHWLGLSVAETAEELGIAEGTVKSHTSRALAALQGLLVHDLTPRRE